ncbi:hypothetical protein EV356DRAFT_496493 [Viridothelium virens]|uniref:Uncharacterized protein n=1 Tax=Viridothelium virens TaxID=1048519 RepID=A0A6A6GTU7_VIRVR|nr:hypothetical protein EV356DRAFT_496493 [Viridothelium virens]
MLFQLIFIYFFITAGALANAQVDSLNPVPRYPPHLVAREIPGPPLGGKVPTLKPQQGPNGSGSGNSGNGSKKGGGGGGGPPIPPEQPQSEENGNTLGIGDTGGSAAGNGNGPHGGAGEHKCDTECWDNDAGCCACGVAQDCGFTMEASGEDV